VQKGRCVSLQHWASAGFVAISFASACSVGEPHVVASQPAPQRPAETAKDSLDDTLRGRCPKGMTVVPASGQERAFCIDRWEATLVEPTPNGGERAVSPFVSVDGRRDVRAVSEPGVYPQGYVSAQQAARACNASGKRLCRGVEWRKACRGPERRAWSYGDRREPGRCNDKGRNPILALFGRNYSRFTMNQPKLNQLDGTLSKTGEHAGCTNGYGVFDMVGNLHEWVADWNGTFVGGYYQDVASLGHGEGCGYTTTAHDARYHDYSTGFRCCADPK
jgi:sulfatase modifying factor 1